MPGHTERTTSSPISPRAGCPSSTTSACAPRVGPVEDAGLDGEMDRPAEQGADGPAPHGAGGRVDTSLQLGVGEGERGAVVALPTTRRGRRRAPRAPSGPPRSRPGRGARRERRADARRPATVHDGVVGAHPGDPQVLDHPARYRAGSAAARSASDRASYVPCRAATRPAGDVAKASGGGVHATVRDSSPSIGPTTHFPLTKRTERRPRWSASAGRSVQDLVRRDKGLHSHCRHPTCDALPGIRNLGGERG